MKPFPLAALGCTAALLSACSSQPPAPSPTLNFAADSLLTQPGQVRLALPVSPGQDIRYTLTGEPPSASSALYSAPLQLSAPEPETGPLSAQPTTWPGVQPAWQAPQPGMEMPRLNVVRMRAFAGDAPAGPVLTRSYALGRDAELLSGPLPVVSLTVDPADWVGPERGIYVPGAATSREAANYNQRGRTSERPVHIEWFEGGQRLLAQDAGVRISGNASRELPQKSLNLYARSDYGPSKFRFAPFGADGPASFDQLRLRTSSQDQEWTRFRDCMIHDLVRPLGVDTQRCRPVRVFVNGEYWGLHNLREDTKPEDLASRHGLNKKDIVILGAYGQLEEADPGDDVPFWELMELLELSAPPQEIEQRLDLDNTFDYLAAQFFVGNSDWPNRNATLWRHTGTPQAGAGDGRWRWGFEDTDMSFNDPTERSLTRVLGRGPEGDAYGGTAVSTVTRYIMAQPELRERFLARLNTHLDGSFAPAVVDSRIRDYQQLLAPEMPRTVARWHLPESVARWEFEVSVLSDFAARRAGFLRAELRELGY